MENTFYTIASFDYPADVQIIKGKLEFEGIPVFLKDENTLNSDPLISYAIGGVKLQVYTRHKQKAMEIYDAIRAYALDEDGNLIICPNCKAERSEVYYLRKGLFLKLFPFFERRKYKCLQCGILTNSK